MSVYICKTCWKHIDYDDWIRPDEDAEGNLICPNCQSPTLEVNEV